MADDTVFAVDPTNAMDVTSVPIPAMVRTDSPLAMSQSLIVMSALAVANLNAICREHLPDRHEIEVVDVLREPKRALSESIFMTPTLVRVSPAPPYRIIGTLSQPDTVLQALGLDAALA